MTNSPNLSYLFNKNNSVIYISGHSIISGKRTTNTNIPIVGLCPRGKKLLFANWQINNAHKMNHFHNNQNNNYIFKGVKVGGPKVYQGGRVIIPYAKPQILSNILTHINYYIGTKFRKPSKIVLAGCREILYPSASTQKSPVNPRSRSSNNRASQSRTSPRVRSLRGA